MSFSRREILQTKVTHVTEHNLPMEEIIAQIYQRRPAPAVSTQEPAHAGS